MGEQYPSILSPAWNMCGRFALAVTPDALARFVRLVRLFTFEPRYNIAPTQTIPIVRSTAEGMVLTPMRWGLIPAWSREGTTRFPLINARSETVFRRPSFRDPIRTRRCVVPATGFYEWDRSQGRKRPYLFRPAQGEMIGLAGIWEEWKPRGDIDKKPITSFTILTTTANERVAPIHDRMPVILPPEAFSAWMDPARRTESDLRPLLEPADADLLERHPVSTRVNSVRNDDPECMDPIRLAEE